MRRLVVPLIGGLSLALAAAPATAQRTDSSKFLKAVRDRDGNVVNELLATPGTLIVNTRDLTSGETALAIAVQRRDLTWVRFLLAKGANPAIADRKGTTPLMHAAMLGFVDGAKAMIDKGAQVDQANGRGETPLILATQNKDQGMVRALIAAGANPDKTDNVTGMSARDYAKRDDRTGTMLELLNAKPQKAAANPLGNFPTTPMQGPK